MTPMVEIMLDQSKGSGSGSSLPVAVLTIAGISTLISVLVSAMSIYFHLKNYLNPHLQRCVSGVSKSVKLTRTHWAD